MELYWLLFLVITVVSKSSQCLYNTPNYIHSYKRGYPIDIPYAQEDIDTNGLELYSQTLKDEGINTNYLELYAPPRYIARNYDSVVQGLSDSCGNYLQLRQQLKQETKKLKKLKATIKKVLPPLLRLLRDDRDDDRYDDRDDDSDDDSDDNNDDDNDDDNNDDSDNYTEEESSYTSPYRRQ